jgi:rhamnulose-1-phosphate aldolase
MPVESPYPELDELISSIGEAGQRLSEIEASEGAAGNISVFLGWSVEPRRRFPIVKTIELPTAVPDLAHGTLLITGSGRRLREIIQNPIANLGCVIVDEGGQTGQLCTSPHRLFTHVTSEFNSHLAVHQDQVHTTKTNFHAVIHAQPPYLTHLSHLPRYQNEAYFNRHILRWQPEMIVNLPQLMAATVESLRRHRVAVWSKHGVVARSDASVKRAADRIEYAETGARYEYLNLVNHESGEGLTTEEIRSICQTFGVQQDIF